MMNYVRVYRRPKKSSPVLELVLCKGCVTPKLCKTQGACSVNLEIEKNKQELQRKLDEEKSKEEDSQANKSKSVLKGKSRSKKKI